MNEGKWTNGKRTVKGRWEYNWCSDNFTIQLDSKDHITGQKRTFISYNDTPEWGKYKLIREKPRS